MGCHIQWGVVKCSSFLLPFGNVSESNKCTVNGCLGPAETCTWKPWLYQDRLEVAAKVTAKEEELEKTALAESTKRSKVLNYIQSLNSRHMCLCQRNLLTKWMQNLYTMQIMAGSSYMAWFSPMPMTKVEYHLLVLIFLKCLTAP